MAATQTPLRVLTPTQMAQASGGLMPYMEQQGLHAGSDASEQASSHRRVLPIRIMKR